MSGPGSNRTSDVEDTIRDFWDKRPVRPQRGGKLAGVSAALGNRYGVDPVLIRVAFVVGAFYGGAGIVLYLLGWLLLPKEGAGEPGRSGSRMLSVPLLVLLALLLIPAIFAVTDFAGLFGLALGVGALYLLHRNYRDRVPASVAPPEQERPADPAPHAHGAGDTGHTWVYPATGPAERISDEQRNTPHGQPGTPPSWDPLGAAPFAWDLPEPAEPPRSEPEPDRPRRSVTLVTLALALLAAGITAAVGGPLTSFTVALGVLGAGLIVGSFLNGGRGLIGFAIPVAALAMLVSALPGGSWRGFTSVQAHPTTAEEVRETYTGSVGSIELHLDDLRVPAGETVRTSANVGLGSISVYLPPDVDATVVCSTERGSLDCLGEQRGGQDVRTRTVDLGPDGPGGGNIVLDLTASTGSVEVTRD